MEQEVTIRRRGGFGKWMLGMVLGGVIGSAVALLAAPQPGVETRRQISVKTRELRGAAMERVDDLRGRAGEIAGEAKGRVQNMLASARGEDAGDPSRALERDVAILETDIDKTYNL